MSAVPTINFPAAQEPATANATMSLGARGFLLKKMAATGYVLPSALVCDHRRRSTRTDRVILPSLCDPSTFLHSSLRRLCYSQSIGVLSHGHDGLAMHAKARPVQKASLHQVCLPSSSNRTDVLSRGKPLTLSASFQSSQLGNKTTAPAHKSSLATSSVNDMEMENVKPDEEMA